MPRDPETSIIAPRGGKPETVLGTAAVVPFELGIAFQPIVDIEDGRVLAYEALVRGPNGESAGWVLSQVEARRRYQLDEACRARAITEAGRLGVATTGALLSVNVLPNAMQRLDTCIRATLHTAHCESFPAAALMFEISEVERVRDVGHLTRVIAEHRDMGFTVAIDDFGAGFAGLSLLAAFTPDVVKLDMALIRGVDVDPRRQAIVRGVLATCSELGTRVIAEGVETLAEFHQLRDLGLKVFQGHLFAAAAQHHLPIPSLPGDATTKPGRALDTVLPPTRRGVAATR